MSTPAERGRLAGPASYRQPTLDSLLAGIVDDVWMPADQETRAGRAGQPESRSGQPESRSGQPESRSGQPESRAGRVSELLAAPLAATTFVVVDLETTGSAPDSCGITEIGAVRLRGGEVLGEFSTLINPGTPIPPYITVLTGITDVMVAPAPSLESVLPSFLEFAAGAVWVAHNAPFDVGFLKAACLRLGYPWPAPPVLDTVTLARRALARDEVPNRKLGTLAGYLRTPNQPSHRALDDARATGDVLHALLERLGGADAGSLGDVFELLKGVSAVRRQKRGLAAGLPDRPGVYLFRDPADRVLYVGTSSAIATRVRSYFTASERRPRIDQLIAATSRIDAVECAHGLEAEVRELRLIAAHQPPYNRRSTRPNRFCWLRFAGNPKPRMSYVRRAAPDGSAYLGPFASRRSADLAAAGLREVARTLDPAGWLAPIDELTACVELATDPNLVVEPFLRRIEALCAEQRYEEAAAARERLAAVLRAWVRGQRLAGITAVPELIAARATEPGGWEIAVIRHGRLAGAAKCPSGTHPTPLIETAAATAESVVPDAGAGLGVPPRGTGVEETERILGWLDRPETRVVSVIGQWCSPANGAGRWRRLLERAERAGRAHREEVSSPE